MAAPKQEAKSPKQEPIYPVIEAFVERASAQDVTQLFASIKQGLGDLKGPKSEQAKKVAAAIARTEELLSHLLQVRETLEAERKGASKARK